VLCEKDTKRSSFFPFSINRYLKHRLENNHVLHQQNTLINYFSLSSPQEPLPLDPRFHARHLSLNNRYPQVIKSEVSLHQQSLSIGSTRAAYNILTLLTPSKQWMTKTPNTAWVTLFCSDVYKIFIKTLTFPWHGKMVTSVALTHKCAWYVAKVNCDKKDLVRQNQPVD